MADLLGLRNRLPDSLLKKKSDWFYVTYALEVTPLFKFGILKVTVGEIVFYKHTFLVFYNNAPHLFPRGKP